MVQNTEVNQSLMFLTKFVSLGAVVWVKFKSRLEDDHDIRKSSIGFGIVRFWLG